MRAILAISALLATGAAKAEGFLTQDISGLGPALAARLGEGYVAMAEARRIIVACPACKGEPLVEIRLDRQDDGTEGRVRSGATPIALLDARCKERQPTCVVTGLDVGPAVGWISKWRTADAALPHSATAVVILDGDLLTIRSLSPAPGAARANAVATLEALRGKVLPR